MCNFKDRKQYVVSMCHLSWPYHPHKQGRKWLKSVLVDYVTSGCGSFEQRKSFLVNFHLNFCRKCPEGANDSTQGVAARVTCGCGQPLLLARQKSASWALVVGGVCGNWEIRVWSDNYHSWQPFKVAHAANIEDSEGSSQENLFDI